MLPAVVAIGSLMSSTVGTMVLRFVAMKAILVVLVTITLPIVLKNLVYWLFTTINSYVSSSLPSGDFSGAVLQFTGLAGYLAVQLRLVDCLAVFVTALVIRSIIMFVPFVK